MKLLSQVTVHQESPLTLEPGELALAITVGPILTFGAVPVVVCDCVTANVNFAPTINAPGMFPFSCDPPQIL
jgi:hypothetical protein